MNWVAGRYTYIWIYAYDLPWTLDDAAGRSLDSLLDTVWSNDAMTTIDGALTFQRDGYPFLSGQ